ncbi:hypothetical protein COX00_03955 [Candidatus Uhrbacteria bacterium CG22_combo_CG10-13_8_21_14_all_47_17]|uniref:Phosphatidic acid phosphatase type 2/haloperoxidase domain-containing protein n=1 Tax=Candidatus Uhrbacteria bacterium CG22_combo_CG10-13_8_21_14_all_47_17 TaxID=1975041 RepID=A0A2H0BRN7_9BACT|nr:MAG: hypothetical protein COX00_03955 [Candidatus Uhrbacteria bacterium CG22_combo_CG10-13_8_21_14_all_47_17]
MDLRTLTIIIGARYLIYFMLLIGGIYFVSLQREQRRQLAIFGITAFLITYIVAWIAGLLYYDPRPFVSGHFIPLLPHAPDNGFPSDHTLLASAIAAVIYPTNRPLGLIFWGLAILVGISRIAAGVHSPIDIIGSMVIAFLVCTGVHAALEARRKQKRNTV